MNKQIKITISKRCCKAYEYLRGHKINPNNYLREGGEIAVINKANEFNLKEKREKQFPNHPKWLYE